MQKAMLGMLDELLGGPGVGESAHVQHPPPNWLRAEPEPASRPSLRGSISSVESGRRGEQRRKRPEPSPRAHATGEGCGEGVGNMRAALEHLMWFLDAINSGGRDALCCI